MMTRHPIASLPFDKRRLFAHEAMAVTAVVTEALKTPVVCEPAKLLGLFLALFGRVAAEQGMAPADAYAEGVSLAQTLEAELKAPDATLLRVLVTSMRANPSEDALDRGDVITLDDAVDLATDDRIDRTMPQAPFWTAGSI
jgi:hypothetical protein